MKNTTAVATLKHNVCWFVFKLETTRVVELQLLVIKSTWRITQGLYCWVELSLCVCVCLGWW